MTPENLKKSSKKFNVNEVDIIASMLLGDGCLHSKGRVNIRHGIPQTDYCQWKCDYINKTLNMTLTVGNTVQCKQLQFQRKDLNTYYLKFYPNKLKSIPVILNYIENHLQAIAIWLCDDGNVCPSINTKTKKSYSQAFQIFTFTDLEDSLFICDWFEKKVGLRPKTLFRDRSKQNKKSAYIIKFSAEDTRTLFKLIKNYIPNVPSMNYKFRYLFSRQDI